MKTLYLTKSGGTTDLSAYSTTAEANALYAPIARPRKNILINGDFQVWQRGTSFAATSTSLYAADRWKWVVSSDAVVTISQSDSVASDRAFSKYITVDVTTADASIAAAQYAGFVYFIEGSDMAHLQMGTAGAATVTLSFEHAHTKTGTHTGSLRNSANDRSYTFEYTQTSANTWEQSEVTVTLDTSGTWLNGNNVGAKLHFAAAVGSNLQTAAGSWTAGNYLGTANQVNNLDSTSNLMRFGNVQLEVGSEATDFHKRLYAEELQLCQRFCFEVNGGHDAICAGAMQSSTQAYMLVPTPVTMRATPTIEVITESDMRVRDGGNLTPSAVAVQQRTDNGIVLSVTVAGGTQYAACSMRDIGTTGILFDAELD